MTYGKLYKRYKIAFYFMSLALLFFLTCVLTIRIPRFWCPYAAPISFREWVSQNVFACLSFSLAIIGVIACVVGVRFHLRSTESRPPCRIIEIENVNYEYLTFLTTFIMPLVCMDFHNPRYILVFFILLGIIGFVLIKTDLYYGNPTLALMGYRLYRAKIQNGEQRCEGIIIITRAKLKKDDVIRWFPIDEKVWVGRKDEVCIWRKLKQWIKKSVRTNTL